MIFLVERLVKVKSYILIIQIFKGIFSIKLSIFFITFI